MEDGVQKDPGTIAGRCWSSSVGVGARGVGVEGRDQDGRVLLRHDFVKFVVVFLFRLLAGKSVVAGGRKIIAAVLAENGTSAENRNLTE